MKEEKNFYITTTIPYVNADPHIGFALELVQSDAVARHRRLAGREVFFSTGTDEYGQKIWEASRKQDKHVQDYVDYYAGKFLALGRLLNLSCDNFIRTTSEGHIRAAQEFWRLCSDNGDIYKKNYKGLYCVGCEKFITEKDLAPDGTCVLHPTLKLQTIEEENYFFRLSRYKEALLEYLRRADSIVPEWRRSEAIEYVENAMEDFSISRSRERLSWGIPVPGDDAQVMYVWFGAFINYISTLGWPEDKEKFEKFWVNGETVQTAGKDMVKFQSVMWQGMLMSAGMKTTDRIMYHGFVTGEGGIRMSKSLGNVINPGEIVEEYGTDAMRYFLLREISSFEDSPFTKERFKAAYNASLANGLGNLASRVLALSEKYLEKCPEIPESAYDAEYSVFFEKFDVKRAADYVWEKIADLDRFIQVTEPFKVIKVNEAEGRKLIGDLVVKLYGIARMLDPLLPATSETLKELIKANKKPAQPLFLRKE